LRGFFDTLTPDVFFIQGFDETPSDKKVIAPSIYLLEDRSYRGQ